MEAIRFENVYFSYGTDEEDADTFALNGVSLSVNEGEFVAVLGHNGSGKSTLARLTDGLLSPASGKIFVLGMDAGDSANLFEIRKNVGIVFQNPDNQTVASIVEDDIAFGPENIGVPREEIGKRIDFALSAVGMTAYRHSSPARLSGGQKQRIAIAGVLALRPKIMILDESTAMLDPRGRKEVIDVVLRLNREEKITVLLITHFPEEALLADRAVVMNRGEIVMQGKPSDILCREEDLETFNLALPRPVALCRALRKGGLPVADAFAPETVAREILAVLPPSGEGAGRDDIPASPVGDGGQGSVYCRGLTHVYNSGSPFETQALNGVNIDVAAGEFFGIIGHTGSGKSTFVQYLDALIKVPTAEKKYRPKKRGKKSAAPEVTLRVDGFDLTDKQTDFRALRGKVGMVFQYPEYQLFAETVSQDVAFGLKNFREGLDEKETEEAVRAALGCVGLEYDDVGKRSPFELSGGQKRRVAIAGVIVTKPEILVLDEPAAGLDPLGKREIMQLLHKIHRDWCKTIIIVSHDMDEISENCTRAAVFSDGKVVMEQPPALLFRRGEELSALGLDIPFTAKVAAGLERGGVHISTDFTAADFVAKTLEYAARNGRAGQSAERGGGNGNA